MRNHNRTLLRKAAGAGIIGLFLTLGQGQVTAATSIRTTDFLTAIHSGPAAVQQGGDEKARAKAKKRYEREQKKIAKRTRAMEKQKAKIEKLDKKIEKIHADMDRQARKVADLEREHEVASNRSRTTDVQLSKIQVNLDKERLKYSKLENSLRKEEAKLNKALKKFK